MADTIDHDLIIIGAGPAGLTASIYASCFHLKHVVIGTSVGGQLNLAPDILNYPGFPNVSGKELLGRMVEQAEKRGGMIVAQSVVRISKSEFLNSKQIPNPKIQNPNNQTENGFEIETLEGKKYRSRALILATGMERRKLNVPGEIEYTGKGVHYCAICEKQDYDGKVVAVVGGGNSALQAAVQLSDVAKKVYILYRGTELRGEKIWLDQISKNKKIEIRYSTAVKEITGDGNKLTGLILEFTGSPSGTRVSQPLDTSRFGKPSLASPVNKINEDIDRLIIDKVFIEIGGVPGTALVIPLGVKMNGGGYIEVNEKLATNVPGIFAAGDMVAFGFSIEQIASAVGLGARAAASAYAYLKEIKAPTLWGASQIKRV